MASPTLTRAHPNSFTYLKETLFSSLWNSVLSIVGLGLAGYVIWSLIDFMVINAVWTGKDRTACLGKNVGACWPFVYAKLAQLIYGFYPAEERWRVNVVYTLSTLSFVALLIPAIPYKKYSFAFIFAVLPVISGMLLVGGVFGLEPVSTRFWGGLLITLVVAMTGITLSLPIGILLALARSSSLPVLKTLAIVFIEFVRGVPLITVLFFAVYIIPLFFDKSFDMDALLRVLIGVALFASAYMAEVIRGGLQAVPEGQYETAKALGFGYWGTMGLIIMPQALKNVIPGIVNTFIGLFKDTTLVVVVSIFDLLGQLSAAYSDPKWSTPTTEYTGLLFVGFIYFFFTYGMSRYSQYIEKRLNSDK